MGVGLADSATLAEPSAQHPAVGFSLKSVAEPARFRYMFRVDRVACQGLFDAGVVNGETFAPPAHFRGALPFCEPHGSSGFAGGMTDTFGKPSVRDRWVIPDETTELDKRRTVTPATLICERLGGNSPPRRLFVFCEQHFRFPAFPPATVAERAAEGFTGHESPL